MRPRQELVERFSTFLQFEGDRPQGWLMDPRLRKSMGHCLGQQRDASVQVGQSNFWALYWHKRWQQGQGRDQGQNPSQNLAQQTPQNHLAANHLAANHLTAYVQEGCYWSAQKATQRFQNLAYGLADCFQMAIAQFHKILRGFDASHGTDFAGYASAAFASLIRELLRQRNEVDICTTWGLLRKLSKKRLTEALLATGLGNEAIASHVLAWDAFKLHYVPTQSTGTRRLPKPSAAEWEAMATFYNQERGIALGAHHPKLAAEAIEQLLQTSARAARAYLYPTQVSMNAQVSGQETEFIDNLPETLEAPPLEQLINLEEAQERQAQRSQLSQVLEGAIAHLDPTAQDLLRYYYRDALTQQDLAARLDLKQYTVSRRLTKIRKTLVQALLDWSQATLHTTPHPDLLNAMSGLLEEWLQQHYVAASSPSATESLV